MSICVTISSRTADECLEKFSSARHVITAAGIPVVAELRGDLCGMTPENLAGTVTRMKKLFPDTATILTWRGNADMLLSTLSKCPDRLVNYADAEIDFSRTASDEIRKGIHRLGGQFISSFHDIEGTPCTDELEDIYGICSGRGADVAKIVTTAHTLEDASKVMELYRKVGKSPALCAFSMGDAGRLTRRLCIAAGSPFTYCAPDSASIAASGQYTAQEMAVLLSSEQYKYRMPSFETLRKELHSAILPSSKSITQRAIIAASLASGTSHLTGFRNCGDTEAAIGAARELTGCSIQAKRDVLTVTGNGFNEKSPAEVIHTGESALLARMILPLASLFDRIGRGIEVEGCGSILIRNFRKTLESLKECGIECFGTETNGIVHLPVRVNGGIWRNTLSVDGSDGSQIITGLLMTLPLLPQDTFLEVKNPVSIPYINLTLNVLKQFGISIDATDERTAFLIRGGQHYRAADISLEPDWSAAAYLLAAISIAAERGLKNIPELSLPSTGDTVQADARICNILANGWSDGFDVDTTDCPDLFPLLAVLGCFARKKCVIRGVHRQMNKESNRAEAIFSELSTLGAHVTVKDDLMTVHPVATLHGGFVLSHNDHRIAMSLTVAALFIDQPVFIDGTECIGKSFPTFIKLFNFTA